MGQVYNADLRVSRDDGQPRGVGSSSLEGHVERERDSDGHFLISSDLILSYDGRVSVGLYSDDASTLLRSRSVLIHHLEREGSNRRAISELIGRYEPPGAVSKVARVDILWQDGLSEGRVPVHASGGLGVADGSNHGDDSGLNVIIIGIVGREASAEDLGTLDSVVEVLRARRVVDVADVDRSGVVDGRVEVGILLIRSEGEGSDWSAIGFAVETYSGQSLKRSGESGARGQPSGHVTGSNGCPRAEGEHERLETHGGDAEDLQNDGRVDGVVRGGRVQVEVASAALSEVDGHVTRGGGRRDAR